MTVWMQLSETKDSKIECGLRLKRVAHGLMAEYLIFKLFDLARVI